MKHKVCPLFKQNICILYIFIFISSLNIITQIEIFNYNTPCTLPYLCPFVCQSVKPSVYRCSVVSLSLLYYDSFSVFISVTLFWNPLCYSYSLSLFLFTFVSLFALNFIPNSQFCQGGGGRKILPNNHGDFDEVQLEFKTKFREKKPGSKGLPRRSVCYDCL